jgi:hypothetical protein
VRDKEWLKLLELACLKLSARDARIELGGEDPTDERLVFCGLDEVRRLVVVFDEPPSDRSAAAEKLSVLAESFQETLAAYAEPQPLRSPMALQRELDLTLAQLAERTGAETIWIIDVQSPVLWGSSEAHPKDLDLDVLLLTADADRDLAKTQVTWAELLAAPASAASERLREAGLTGKAMRAVQDELEILRQLSEQGGLAAAARRLRTARALAEIKKRTANDHTLLRCELRGPDIQCFAHSLAGQYQLILVFDETYSPLHAEGNVQRAMPHIERLLLSLPPIDPETQGARGAKVIRLPRKR